MNSESKEMYKTVVRNNWRNKANTPGVPKGQRFNRFEHKGSRKVNELSTNTTLKLGGVSHSKKTEQ